MSWRKYYRWNSLKWQGLNGNTVQIGNPPVEIFLTKHILSHSLLFVVLPSTSLITDTKLKSRSKNPTCGLNENFGKSITNLIFIRKIDRTFAYPYFCRFPRYFHMPKYLLRLIFSYTSDFWYNGKNNISLFKRLNAILHNSHWYSRASLFKCLLKMTR